METMGTKDNLQESTSKTELHHPKGARVDQDVKVVSKRSDEFDATKKDKCGQQGNAWPHQMRLNGRVQTASWYCTRALIATPPDARAVWVNGLEVIYIY